MVKGSCKSILVVEDDPDIRSALIELLESEGYKTKSASNGQEALQELEHSSKPCLVLLDMMMPIMNGREFLDVIMRDSHLAPIPVIVVSAIADKVSTDGAQGFIKKPIDIDTILEVVSQYCH